VSLAGDPVEEIAVGKGDPQIAGTGHGAGWSSRAPPAEGRRSTVAQLATRVEAMVADVKSPVRIAVMGCVVNGPGEARDADLGIPAQR